MCSHPVAVQNIEWKQYFEGVIDLCASLYWQDDRVELFKVIAEKLREITDADNVNLRLLTNTEDAFVTYVTDGDIDENILLEYSVLLSTEGRMPQLMKTLTPIIFDFEMPDKQDIPWTRGTSDGYALAVTLPLISDEKVVGVCDLLYRAKPNMTDEYIDMLSMLGRLIGTVVSNSLLMESQISLRIENDRKRISDEIHDNISQLINVIAFESGNMVQSIEENDEELLKHQLNRISKASEQAVKLLRGEIVQLKKGFDIDASSAFVIKDYVETFARRWGINCVFNYESAHDEMSISGRVGVQLMRILNEALTNIIRHAGADTVKIELEENAGALTINVVDDGCGFDVNQVASECLGIKSMKERAHAVDGEVFIVSEQGSGTRVSIFLPHLT